MSYTWPALNKYKQSSSDLMFVTKVINYGLSISVNIPWSEYSLSLKAHNLPISVSKTNTRNFCIVTTCEVMPMYEITISKSFAN